MIPKKVFSGRSPVQDWLMCSACAACLLPGTASAVTVTTPASYGDLDLGGSTSAASGVSADGSVVAGYALTSGDLNARAFHWTFASGVADLGALGGAESLAFGVNADGSVVVGKATTSGDAAFHAFRWRLSLGASILAHSAGAVSGRAAAVPTNAVVLGNSYTSGDAAILAFR